MKALTLRQPWATLVATEMKTIETRSWSTGHRGPIAIHAAKSFPREAREVLNYPEFKCVRWLRLPLGCVIATAWLADCVRVPLDNDLEADLFLSRDLKVECPNVELGFGDFTPGRFAWILKDIKRLDEPAIAKGALGLWEWPNV